MYNTNIFDDVNYIYNKDVIINSLRIIQNSKCGASTTSFATFSEKYSFSTILFIVKCDWLYFSIILTKLLKKLQPTYILLLKYREQTIF